MKKLIYRTNKTVQYSIIDLATMEHTGLTREGEEQTTFLGLGEEGRCAYYCKCTWTLRDYIGRKTQYRYYRYDMETGASRELFTNWDRSGFSVMTMLPLEADKFFILGAYSYTQNRAWFTNADGSRVEHLWDTTGYPYGFVKSPVNGDVVYHMALEDAEFNPNGNVYSVNRMAPDGSRAYLCGTPGATCFGPVWSPDGQWLAFQRCFVENDPAHHYSDLCICRPDGGEYHAVTEGNCHYFATSAGLPEARTAGSNTVRWTADGKLLYAKLLPGSHPDCHFDGSQANHEELIYDPAMGRGGSCLMLLDPFTGREERLTPAEEGLWAFRACLSADNREIAFTRTRFGERTEICILNRENGVITPITAGDDGLGADYPSFLEV